MSKTPGKALTTRRGLLRGAGAVGLAAAGLPRSAWAATGYPSRNINIVIATGQGGGAEITARNFTNVMRGDLGVDFEYEFHPGAGGQVGYELYTHRRDRDGYNLLYSNIQSEVCTYAVQDTNYRLPEDVFHFAKTNGSPIAMYTGANSPFRTIEELVEEAQRRPVSIATSRLPHPGSIGVLALAEATGADFNLIPFGGGNPTSMAAITGEVDCAVLTSNSAIALGDQVRTLAVFRDVPEMRRQMGNPPLVNEAFGTDLPDLELSSAFAIHTEVWENDDEVRETLVGAIRRAFDEPQLQRNFEESGYPWEAVEYGDHEECQRIVRTTIELAERYRDLLQEA